MKKRNFLPIFLASIFALLVFACINTQAQQVKTDHVVQIDLMDAVQIDGAETSTVSIGPYYGTWSYIVVTNIDSVGGSGANTCTSYLREKATTDGGTTVKVDTDTISHSGASTKSRITGTFSGTYMEFYTAGTASDTCTVTSVMTLKKTTNEAP